MGTSTLRLLLKGTDLMLILKKMPESDFLLARICFDKSIRINVKMVRYVNLI